MSEARDRLAEDVHDIRERVGRIEAQIPHLALHADFARIEERLASELPHLATRAEVVDVRTELKATELRLIEWLIGVAVSAVLIVSAQLWGAIQLLLHRGHP